MTPSVCGSQTSMLGKVNYTTAKDFLKKKNTQTVSFRGNGGVQTDRDGEERETVGYKFESKK